MSEKYSDRDPYVDQNGVLKNRFGITDQESLDKIEAAFAVVRSAELQEKPAPKKYDLEHLQKTHKQLFGDVYDWAGEIRQVDIQKGETRFANAEMIPSAGNSLFRKLAQEQNLKGLDPDAFSNRAGHYLGEINALHPFREGNGRTQREFISQLARDSGYHIDWSRVTRSEMVAASIEAYHATSDRLARLIRDNLTDLDREKAAAMARTYAGERAHIERAEEGQKYTGKLIGTTDRYIVQERSDRAGEVVLHNRRAVTGDPEKLQGRSVEISYPHGKAGLLKADPQHERGQDLAHQHDRPGSHDKGR